MIEIIIGTFIKYAAVAAESIALNRQQWFRIRKAALGYDVPRSQQNVQKQKRHGGNPCRFSLPRHLSGGAVAGDHEEHLSSVWPG